MAEQFARARRKWRRPRVDENCPLRHRQPLRICGAWRPPSNAVATLCREFVAERALAHHGRRATRVKL